MEEVGIYKLYKLGRVEENIFSKDFKTLERDLHAVHHDYAKSINESYETCGFMYELDTKATKLYSENKPYKITKEYNDFEEIIDDVIESKGINKISIESNQELANLKNEYFTLSGKEGKTLWGVKKYTEEIKKFKN